MSFREILSENLLDVNFVKLISPIYWLQFALASNCIVIRDNLISDVTFSQKLYTIVWIIVVSGSFYKFELFYYNIYFDKELTLFYTYSFGVFVQYFCYLCHILHARFYKGQQTVKVFLTLQKVDHALKENNVVSLGVVNYYINIIWILYIILAFGSGFTIYVFFRFENAVYTFPMGLALMSVYFETVFTGICIYYLAVRLSFLNDIIRANIFYKKLGNSSCQPTKVDQTVAISVLKVNTDDVISISDFRCIVTSILKLFHDISDLFSFQIFNIVLTVFIWTFLGIESTVVGQRNKLVSVWESVLLMLWMVFCFVQLTLVTVTCDWFAQQVYSTKHLALKALSVFVEALSPMLPPPQKADYGVQCQYLEIFCFWVATAKNFYSISGEGITLTKYMYMFHCLHLLWHTYIFAASVLLVGVCFIWISERLVLNVLKIIRFISQTVDEQVKIRKTAWEIIKLIEFQKPIFSVRGIFIFDKRLPLKLIGLITSNVLVLIQYTSNALNTN